MGGIPRKNLNKMVFFFHFTAHHLLRPQSYARIYKYLSTQLQVPWIKNISYFIIRLNYPG